MRTNPPLPPGQRDIESFPRFGLTPFAVRFPKETGTARIQITGDVEASVEVSKELDLVARVEQCSDFHCVTTWTHRALHWSGIRFSDFYQQIVMPLAGPAPGAAFV
ncbi:MAG TPA: hypothetical protein VL025_02180, partial [Thermoanaerobaculia bacterium]|nr:hypothetical protein [Thermoanaerobaculia bacterium]